MPYRALAVWLLLVPIAAVAADRGPSTPAERKQALVLIHRFESDPLNQNLNPELQSVLEWTREVPDIRLSLCTSFFKLRDPKANDGPVLFNAMALAQTAFAIEHPEQQDDGLAQVQAGVEGVLRTYDVLLKARPNERQPYLDMLIKRREEGSLAAFVKRHASSSCGN